MTNASFQIDNKFIELTQKIYFSDYVILYIDDVYGSMLNDKEVNIIYKVDARKPRALASFLTVDDMYKYISDICETDNTIKHIRFRINNVVFCLAKRKEA